MFYGGRSQREVQGRLHQQYLLNFFYPRPVLLEGGLSGEGLCDAACCNIYSKFIVRASPNFSQGEVG